MKIRNGFVSNSSSSSFIVALDDVPVGVADTIKLLFKPEQTQYPNPYVFSDSDPYGWAVSDIAAIVLRDLHDENNRYSREKLIEEVASSYICYEQASDEIPFPEGNWKDDGYEEKWQKAWVAREARSVELAIPYVDAFLSREDTVNKKLYRLEYSDSDGALFSAMEHGDLFDEVPHVKISHH